MTERLLEWMSYRERGHANDLPRDLLPPDGPRWILSDLAILAHAETGPDGRWRVTPPVLAAIGDESDGTKTAVLCGARTRGVMDRLTQSCKLNGAEIRNIPQKGRPDCVLVTASSASDICSVATASGLNWQRDAGFTLLACLPTIRDWPRSPCPMVAGKIDEVRRFSKTDLRWIPSSLEEAQQAIRGLFHIKRDWSWIVLLKEGKDTQSEIDMAAGRLAIASGSKKIHVDLKSRSLRIPLALKPPTVVSRALALCSGMLPEIETEKREMTFRSISNRIARLAVSVTGLKLA